MVVISATLFVMTLINIKQKQPTQPPRVITLSNTDTIYKKIEKLTLNPSQLLKNMRQKLTIIATLLLLTRLAFSQTVLIDEAGDTTICITIPQMDRVYIELLQKDSY
jgi:hypothetical protein